MSDSSDNRLVIYFEQVKTLGFFARLFSWKKFLATSFEAYREYGRLAAKLDGITTEFRALEADNRSYRERSMKMETDYEFAKAAAEKYAVSSRDNDSEISRLTELNWVKELKIDELNETIRKLDQKSTELAESITKNELEVGRSREYEDKNAKRIHELESETAIIRSDKARQAEEIVRLEKKIAEMEQVEVQRRVRYDENVVQLNALKQLLDNDRLKMEEQLRSGTGLKFEEMSHTWHTHEIDVKERLRGICQACGVEYVGKENAPFGKKTYSTIRICDDLVIFDAVVPLNEDLSTFREHVRLQAEASRIYAIEDGVYKQVFLVVPTNTITFVDAYHMMSNYDVHVVTIDNLRLVVGQLKRINDYHLLGRLSPDDRDNISRVIGKLIYISKRRILMDSQICAETNSILNSCSGSLPASISSKALEYENSERLSPSMDKRDGAISADDLRESAIRTQSHEAGYHGSGILGADENAKIPVEAHHESTFEDILNKLRGQKQR
ncbi:MAG TPA: hypothetical protein VK436_00360 [Methanocella sp.]|nr:hypothetical protein [Methanocella sp.]